MRPPRDPKIWNKADIDAVVFRRNPIGYDEFVVVIRFSHSTGWSASRTIYFQGSWKGFLIQFDKMGAGVGSEMHSQASVHPDFLPKIEKAVCIDVVRALKAQYLVAEAVDTQDIGC